MRALLPLIVVGVLAACAPEIPDSAAIGFDNSEDARRAREIALNGAGPTGAPIVPPVAISGEPLPQASGTQVARANTAPVPAQRTPARTASAGSGDIAQETAAALAASSANSGVAPVEASPSNPAPVALNNPGISSENDFASVSDRRSIKGDADRIARNREAYQVIQPTAVPSRSGNGGPNIVEYALSTTHARGTRIHTRAGINLAAKAQRACARYASPDQAQIAFLSGGGPRRDRLGLDPDGDGFACAWNPAPFRKVAQSN